MKTDKDLGLLGTTVSGDSTDPPSTPSDAPCLSCGGPHRFDMSVPSELWNAVIRGNGLPDYLCAGCVVRAFAMSGVSFSAKLYGDGFSGLPIRVIVNGAD